MPAIKPPTFPQKYFNVKDFGAVNDGSTIKTRAFQNAIDECSNAGGEVIVPAGNFATGVIFLKSNVELNLEMGNRILETQKER